MKGLVFNIQRYSLHDGPGIRTVVFLKGCPLRCRWCCNPESQEYHPEISYYASKCIGMNDCSLCRLMCSDDAIGFGLDGRARINREKCSQCCRCADSCPSKAIRTEGRQMTVEQVLDEVEKEAVFYRAEEGGITISGGEPLAQGDFLLTLLQEARYRKIHTAMETCGFGGYDTLREAAALLDMILYDIKTLDDEQHFKWTGQSNRIILSNFERLCEDSPQLAIKVRTPIIPGFNDNVEEIFRIVRYVRTKPGVTFEALPYHRFGVGKYEALGRKYDIEGSLAPSTMRRIETLYKGNISIL